MFAKTITVVHDLQYVFFPQYFTRSLLWYRLLWVPMSIRRSDRVGTISETVKDEIRREYGREDVTVFHQAIAVDPLSGCEPLADIPEPFFLVPSILSFHKNIENLVSAICQYVGERPLPYLVFIGAYSAESFPYEIPSELGRVLGYVDRELRDRLMARCAAVVLPSLYEGFGMPYAEALLVGRPVIACDIPIAREVLGDEGTFIQPDFGPQEIIAAIGKFLSEGQEPPGPEAVARLEARTQPRRVAGRYLESIRGLIDT
jgi:glycosyltransferase involved in cell wall biosynthesis